MGKAEIPAPEAKHLAYYALRSRMVTAERKETVRLRDANVINDDVMNRLLRALDLEEIILNSMPGRR